MNGLISILNTLSVEALQNMTSKPNTLRLWIENGQVTGFVDSNGKLYKKSPHRPQIQVGINSRIRLSLCLIIAVIREKSREKEINQ